MQVPGRFDDEVATSVSETIELLQQHGPEDRIGTCRDGRRRSCGARWVLAEVVDNAAYGTGCEALVLLLGDKPVVRPGFMGMAPSRWRRERPWASVTSCRGEIEHPFVFAREAFGDLRRLHGDKAVWKRIEARHPERVSRTQIDAVLPPDVDIPEDHGLAPSRWRSTGAS